VEGRYGAGVISHGRTVEFVAGVLLDEVEAAKGTS
jgi:hypothetical protein